LCLVRVTIRVPVREAARREKQATTHNSAFCHQASSKAPWQPARTVLPQTERACKASSQQVALHSPSMRTRSSQQSPGITAGSTHPQSLESCCFRPTRHAGIHHQERGAAGSGGVNASDPCVIGKSILRTGVGSGISHHTSAGRE
jgi:hypothetical protein